MRPDLQLLITVETGRFGPTPRPLNGCDHIVGLDSDFRNAARAFLDHWRPDLCLWAGADLMPGLIGAARDGGLPMILLDIGETDFRARRRAWFPDLVRRCLNGFDVILTSSESTATTLRRMGVTAPRIDVTDRLRNSATPPPCSDEELADVTKEISSRPVWLAAHLRTDEFDAVLFAHRAALRLLHRLLLVVVTDAESGADDMRDQLTGQRLRSIDWDTGESIDDNTQVVLSRDADNLGLWYRVAPLTLMASSLTPDATGRNPLTAAALGSAVLYGPYVEHHVEAYAHLAAAGAARAVRDGDALANAVIQLAAPDHAAAMALAGWEVVTEGAAMTDKLVDLILDNLDRRQVQNAPA